MLSKCLATIYITMVTTDNFSTFSFISQRSFKFHLFASDLCFFLVRFSNKKKKNRNASRLIVHIHFKYYNSILFDVRETSLVAFYYYNLFQLAYTTFYSKQFTVFRSSVSGYSCREGTCYCNCLDIKLFCAKKSSVITSRDLADPDSVPEDFAQIHT